MALAGTTILSTNVLVSLRPSLPLRRMNLALGTDY